MTLWTITWHRTQESEQSIEAETASEARRKARKEFMEREQDWTSIEFDLVSEKEEE